MRKILPILLLWVCYWLPSFGQQQWKWLNPQPSGAAGLKIIFADSQTGFILNSDGQGGWKYSSPISITAAGVAKPVVTRSGDVLWSSAPTGNQWYLNGVAIPGAIDNGWSPRETGSYAVQATQNGCTSLMSDSVLVSGTVKAGVPEVVSDTACTEKFSATLQTISVSADSISFEITAPDLTITNIAASPHNLNNASTTETASSNKFVPGKTYSVKLKLRVSGSYSYSDAVSFALPDLSGSGRKPLAANIKKHSTFMNQRFSVKVSVVKMKLLTVNSRSQLIMSELDKI